MGCSVCTSVRYIYSDINIPESSEIEYYTSIVYNRGIKEIKIYKRGTELGAEKDRLYILVQVSYKPNCPTEPGIIFTLTNAHGNNAVYAVYKSGRGWHHI